MKKFIFSLMMLAITLSTYTLYAQQPQQHQRQPQQRDGNFAEFQLQVITKQLQLDESKKVAFTKLYTEYSSKAEALQPKLEPRQGSGNGGEKPARPTDAQVEEKILESFVMAEKSTELKREYYYKFKEILTPSQIFKMYNLERRLRERIVSESDRRSDGNNGNNGQR